MIFVEIILFKCGKLIFKFNNTQSLQSHTYTAFEFIHLSLDSSVEAFSDMK